MIADADEEVGRATGTVHEITVYVLT